MATPASHNLKFVRGDTQDFTITLTEDGTTPRNITGCTYRAQIRTDADASSVSGEFSCTVTDPTTGVVRLVLSASTSASLPDTVLYWDFEQNNGGVVTTLIHGKCTVLGDVTR
jgi:hypothetical protein